MNILGNTLQLIAGEKAGIIKKGVPPYPKKK
jgi:folylpolyglutamate synthase/dihydropteroate synthase